MALNTTVVLWSVVTLVGSLVAFLTILSLADKKQQAPLSFQILFEIFNFLESSTGWSIRLYTAIC